MIIWGTRGVRFCSQRGEFYCPICQSTKSYAKKRVRKFFTLYFIPIIPLNNLGEYVECGTCENTFKPEVLSFDPTADARIFRAEFERAMKRVLLMMTSADGTEDNSEYAAVQDVFESLTNARLSDAEVRQEAEKNRNSEAETLNFLTSINPSLNTHGKELVMKAAFLVAAADGQLHDRESDLLTRIGEALDISEAHRRGIIQEVMRQPDTGNS